MSLCTSKIIAHKNECGCQFVHVHMCVWSCVWVYVGVCVYIFLYLRLVLRIPGGLENLFYPLNTHGEIEDFFFCLTGALGNTLECSVPQGYYLFPQCHLVLPWVLPVTGWCSLVLFHRMLILGSPGSLGCYPCSFPLVDTLQSPCLFPTVLPWLF